MNYEFFGLFCAAFLILGLLFGDGLYVLAADFYDQTCGDLRFSQVMQNRARRHKEFSLFCGVLWLAIAAVRLPSGAVCVMEEAAFATVLLAAAFIDEETGYVPDFIPLVIFVLGAACCIFGEGRTERSDRLLGLAIALAFYGGSYFISKIALKKEGMGIGDVALMAASGTILGLGGSIFATLIATLSAAVVLSVRVKKDGESEVGYPFVPFLALGCICAIAFDNGAIALYLSFFN